MRAYLGPVALCLCVLVGCSGSKDLSRSQAAEIITKQSHFPRPVTWTFSLGRINPGVDTMEQFLTRPMGKTLKSDEEDGLLTLKWEGTVRSPLGMMVPIVQVDLTDKGKEYVVGNIQNNGNSAFASIKMCEEILDEVTGIEGGEGGQLAKVEYTVKQGNLTPFGKHQVEVLGNSSGVCVDANPRRESAVLSLYDDGWRIKN